jgi:hypothetical protein
MKQIPKRSETGVLLGARNGAVSEEIVDQVDHVSTVHRGIEIHVSSLERRRRRPFPVKIVEQVNHIA